RKEKPQKGGAPFLDVVPPWRRLCHFDSLYLVLGIVAVFGWLVWGTWAADDLMLLGLVVLFFIYVPLLWAHGLSSWKEPLHLTIWSDDEEGLYNAVARFWEAPGQCETVARTGALAGAAGSDAPAHGK